MSDYEQLNFAINSHITSGAYKEKQLYLDFEAELIEDAKSKINQTVHAYLMEKLNQQLIQGLGHRTYSEFIRSRPRSEWTDDLLVADMQGFLVQHKLKKPEIEFAIERIQAFAKTGLLLRQTES